MPKKACFFKNKTVLGILGVVLVFAMFATGCPNGTTDPPEPTPLPTYTVTFDVDGGSAVDNQTVEEGKTVPKPANPTKADHTFANWYRDTAKTTLWNFDTDVIVQATTIYAKWVQGDNVPSFEVTFDTDGGSTAPAKQTVLQGEPVQEPAKPTKTGYIFDGWYKTDGTTKWNFSADTVSAATTLKAQWIEAVTVTFVTNGGSAIAPVTVAKGNNVYLSDYRPTKSGSVFDGWYKDAEFKESAGNSLTVPADITLYAKWTSTSALAGYEGVWRYESNNEAYWLQADGTAWRFYGSDSYFSFYKSTWSTSQVDGGTGTFNEAKTEFTQYSSTFTKNTATTKTPAAATGALLGVWVNGGQSVELKTNGDAVLTGYNAATITLKYRAETDAIYLLQPETNLVILSIGITDSKLNGLSKPTTDSSLAGIWKLTEDGQDYYWTLTANGSGTFHTLGASVPFSFTVTEDKEIDGYEYEVSGNTLTLPGAGGWDNETQKYVDITLTKATSTAGSGADGDSRLHGTWKMTQGSETITVTIKSDGTMTQSWGDDSETVIWKADGSTFYSYSYSFDSSRVYPQKYSISGSSLTISNDYGEEYVLTRQ